MLPKRLLNFCRNYAAVENRSGDSDDEPPANGVVPLSADARAPAAETSAPTTVAENHLEPESEPGSLRMTANLSPPPSLYKPPSTHVAIMPNGNIGSRRYLEIDDGRVKVRNTCAFDTLLQMFACAALDGGPPFGPRALGDGGGAAEPPGPFVELLRYLVTNGSTHRALELRAGILCEAFSGEHVYLRGVYHYNLNCYVKAMADRVLTKDLPTGWARRGCTEPACPRPRRTEAVATVAYSSHTGRFDGFQEAVAEEVGPLKVPCTRYDCPGEWTSETELTDHLLVEVLNIPPDTLFDREDYGAQAAESSRGGGGLLTDAAAVYGDVSCPVDDVPKRVTVRGDQYELRAVAAFVNPTKRARADNIGHYVAIALRGHHWLEYDGLRPNVSYIAGTSKRNVQMVLYTKQPGSQ